MVHLRTVGREHMCRQISFWELKSNTALKTKTIFFYTFSPPLPSGP